MASTPGTNGVDAISGGVLPLDSASIPTSGASQAPAPVQANDLLMKSSNHASTKDGGLISKPEAGAADFAAQVTTVGTATSSVSKADVTGHTGKGTQAGNSDSTGRDQDGGQAVLPVPSPTALQIAPATAGSASLHAHGVPADQSAQAITTDSSATGLGANTSETSAQRNAVAPSNEAYGAVNTSRLLQTLGQSEMKVGLRSTDFGDISIRTFATSDNIVAQISLSHEDLAKSLTAHIPEMQARIGAASGFEITVNAAERSAGPASSLGDTGTGSQGNGQQEQSARSYPSRFTVSGVSEQLFPASVLANTTHNSVRKGRIDLQA